MEKKISSFIIVYLIIGLIFAIFYAIFYHWPMGSFLSPGFYAVVFTWPFQLPGFFLDLQYYGLSGKTLS